MGRQQTSSQFDVKFKDKIVKPKKKGWRNKIVERRGKHGD